VFKSLVNIKNLAYNSNWKKAEDLSVPVVSVGNLTVGGTGKTPLILELLQSLKTQGLAAGVISRGYKSGFIEPTEVVADSETFFGDEPTLVKSRFPKVPFFIAAKRVLAGQSLLKKYPQTQLILADDAFQHRQLARDLDIVILDATRSKEEYLPLPLGRAREGLESLSRADVIVMTKLYMSGAATPHQISAWIDEHASLKPDALKVETQIRLSKPQHIHTKEGVDDFTLRRKRWVLISAIGNPSAFESSVKQELKLKVARHKRFEDHYSYVAEDLKGLLGEESLVLTTEKDAVKLRPLVSSTAPIYSTSMSFEFLKGKEDLLAKVSGLVAKTN
ncbi:MAG: tetraacyldisaccharide 4'-kinase, partial [Pseudomonadota bacterium]